MTKKQQDWDDGRTVAPMTGEELPAYRRVGARKVSKTEKAAGGSDITKKERRAMRRALFAVMLPRLLVVLASFAVVFILIYLWLS